MCVVKMGEMIFHKNTISDKNRLQIDEMEKRKMKEKFQKYK